MYSPVTFEGLKNCRTLASWMLEIIDKAKAIRGRLLRRASSASGVCWSRCKPPAPLRIRGLLLLTLS